MLNLTKTYFLGCIFLFSSVLLSGQKLDLIVTNNQDSIACKIDSIDDENIYFATKRNMTRLHSRIPKSLVTDYKYKYISRNLVKPISSSIYFRTMTPQELAIPKNRIHGHLGHFGPFFTGYFGSYDRLLLNRPGNILFPTLWLNFSGGNSLYWEEVMLSAALFAMTGTRSNHLEFRLGIGGYAGNNSDPDSPGKLFPVGGLAYCFQKPEGGFLFRAGFSFPEVLHIGVGYNF